MAPIEVELTPTQPRNVIYYTSLDGNVITPNNPDVFGASILSNEYVEGLGVITFDGDVTSIGDWAFSGCSGLTSITIPEGVTSIGNYAFNACTRLTSITIPNSVTSIGEWSFFNCTTLTSITIPESVTSIGEAAFTGCFSLMSFSGKYSTPDGLFLIDSGNNLVAVALGAMHGAITIPDGVTSIGVYAFCGCRSLISITIPDGVTSIEKGAFQDCSSLTSIAIPDGVTNLGVYAFMACTSLTSITIPESVTDIGYYACSYCSSLTCITVNPEVPPTGSWDMFRGTNNAPIYVPTESVEAYKSAQYWSDYADRIQAIPSSSVPAPEAVDMGLSVKWASFNLGASAPEEIGDYYAWGETEPYYSSQDPLTWKEGKEAGYAWTSYKWCMWPDNKLTKYCSMSSEGYNGFVDDKVVLDLEDDAAHVNLGGDWRMPTYAEWEELRKQCTWTWTTRNGIAGRRVTARNGNSIFLPVAGYRSGTHLYDADDEGDYWSSSLYVDAPYNNDSPSFAWMVIILSGNTGIIGTYRHLGMSVRPVSE